MILLECLLYSLNRTVFGPVVRLLISASCGKRDFQPISNLLTEMSVIFIELAISALFDMFLSMVPLQLIQKFIQSNIHEYCVNVNIIGTIIERSFPSVPALSCLYETNPLFFDLFQRFNHRYLNHYHDT